MQATRPAQTGLAGEKARATRPVRFIRIELMLMQAQAQDKQAWRDSKKDRQKSPEFYFVVETSAKYLLSGRTITSIIPMHANNEALSSLRYNTE